MTIQHIRDGYATRQAYKKLRMLSTDAKARAHGNRLSLQLKYSLNLRTSPVTPHHKWFGFRMNKNTYNHTYNFTCVVVYAVYTSEHFDSKLIKNKRNRIE